MRFSICGFIVALVFASCASLAAPTEHAEIPIADAFDFPVGAPDGAGYHKARGYSANGHLGEDWNGHGGGDSDEGDPVCAIGNGIVVLARDVQLGWGNVVILRHAYWDEGELKYIDSLYGHLSEIAVREGEIVRRGQRIGGIGNNRGMYHAHLHFEIRKNLRIGMKRSAFPRDYSCYFDPTDFIKDHRAISGGPEKALVALNTFQESAERYDAPTPKVNLLAEVHARKSMVAQNSKPRRKGPFIVDRYSDMR
jgi:murein DD-endopeptidase MepM/ murein hydrolase activator NlpD